MKIEFDPQVIRWIILGILIMSGVGANEMGLII